MKKGGNIKRGPVHRDRVSTMKEGGHVERGWAPGGEEGHIERERGWSHRDKVGT
jgi:hypothetical protein